MKLKVIMLGEIRKEVKDNYWMVSLICGTERTKTKTKQQPQQKLSLRLYENYGYHFISLGGRTLVLSTV